MSEINEKDFQLERYKYICSNIQQLNKNIQTYLNQFQNIAISIIGASILIFINWKPLNINNDIAISGIRYLYLSLILIGLFIIVRIVVSILSWFDYRNEEAELLNNVISENFRKKPQLKNIWRWDELYSIMIILIVIGAFCLFCEFVLIPNTK